MALESFPRGMPSAGLVPHGNLLWRIEATGAEIWMAGADSHVGDELPLGWFETAWVLDCAGELPAEYRRATARWEACVFPDIEVRPDRINRLRAIAADFAQAALLPEGPGRFVSVCHHGMNRSGLAAGLILRSLGLEGDEVVRLIRAGRPGALGNRAFETIVREPWL